MASPMAAIRNSLNEEDCTFSRLLSEISDDGRAIQKVNRTPPSSSDWKIECPRPQQHGKIPEDIDQLKQHG